MNECCKKEITKLNNHLADTAESLIKISNLSLNLGSANRTIMEEAAYRRAEIIVDVMGQIKEFVNKK
jgi:hypothetical protein